LKFEKAEEAREKGGGKRVEQRRERKGESKGRES
jgi:hypothetical protein